MTLTLKNDKNLAQLIRYYSKQQDFVNFLIKLARYSMETVIEQLSERQRAKLKKYIPRLNITDLVRHQFQSIFEQMLREKHTPQGQIEQILDLYQEQWDRVIQSKNFLQDLGGPANANLIAGQIYDQICKFYDIGKEEIQVSEAQEFFL